MRTEQAVRIVALFEAFKGVLALCAATGFLALLHTHIHSGALRLLRHLHLNPAAEYPRIFLHAAGQLNDSRLLWLALGAALYALLRGVEAYGLFRQRAWAEVLAAFSGAIYIPFELAEIYYHPSWLAFAMLLINLAVVLVMVYALREGRKARNAQLGAGI